jgi:hypothetical protein
VSFPGARPAEGDACAAKEAQTAQALADLRQDLHGQEVMAVQEGAPSIAVQNATHGAPAPPPDRGKGS